jgi:prepilin-type N-terminal cleavage/methylation domain-containing protein
MFTQKKHSNHKKYLTYIHAFTLVELIIVITILAILATVAFISFKNYYDNTRDSVRVTDVRNIFEGLTIFKVKSGNYPLPDNYIDISAGSGNILTHQ